MFHRLTRNRWLAIILIVLLLTLIGTTFFLIRTPASTLAAAAATKGRIFGAAVEGNRLGATPYTTILDSEFSGLTPANDMKWETTEPAQGSFNFAPADAIVSHAEQHNMKIRGQTLVWYNQLPASVHDLTSGSEVLQIMRNHIQVEVNHYKGQIWYWDVVNEAFNDSDGTRRSNPFQNLIGNSYIEEAFKAAHAADPN